MNSLKSSKKKTTLPVESSVRKDTVWAGNNFIQFQVNKITKKAGKVWIHYHVRDNPKQKYSCYEEAFLHRFYPLTNLY